MIERSIADHLREERAIIECEFVLDYFVDIRDPGTQKLLCRYDPHHDLIEIAERGRATVVDLKQYRA